MNEKVIIVGNDNGKIDGKIGYFAHYANDGMIYAEPTPEGAIKKLFERRYPTIWFMNDKGDDFPTVTGEDDPEKGIKGMGIVPAEFIDKKEMKLLVKDKYCRNCGVKKG